MEFFEHHRPARLDIVGNNNVALLTESRVVYVNEGIGCGGRDAGRRNPFWGAAEICGLLRTLAAYNAIGSCRAVYRFSVLGFSICIEMIHLWGERDS